tara:strand:- start:19022 stop:20119 length:1098 start_codon:yes stop_codon:yes gene_type:complete
VKLSGFPLYPIGIPAGILVLCLAFSGRPAFAQSIEYEDPVPRNKAIHSIAFGSCMRQNRPAPILDAINGIQPDVFIFLGDNVYADTDSATEMQSRYSMLRQKPGFQKLVTQSRIHAIWDDHDYGANDAGADFAFRRESERIFKSFWGLSDSKPYRNREGIYASFLYRTTGRYPIKVQLILLDTRSFRSAWKTKPWWQSLLGLGLDGPYLPDSDPEKTMLGAEQWKWLEYQFQVQADLRIVASSIQVLSSANGFETWSNFPSQKERLLNLAAGSQGSVVFISGDRHFAEISAQSYKGKVFFDVTSSSLNQPLDFGEEENPLRQGNRFPGANFGQIVIQDTSPSWTAELQILDEKGEIRMMSNPWKR